MDRPHSRHYYYYYWCSWWFFWLTRVIVRDELTKATRPIQPGYRNGGESLSDIADTVKRIAKHVGLEDK